MKNFIKLNVIFIAFSIIFPLEAFSGEPIFPQPKPEINQETKAKILKEKLIYPVKKPDDDIEKEEYCQQKDKQTDWDKTKFYDDMELEDKYTSQMEYKDDCDDDDY